MIEYLGPPDWWIAEGGRPAKCLGDCRNKRTGGLPSFEHEDGELVVYDLLLAFSHGGGFMYLLSRWYGVAAVLAPEDMVPLHHTPPDMEILDSELTAITVHSTGAWWQWRPVVYSLHMDGDWRAMSSQQELAWRYGLHEVSRQQTFTMDEAEARAEALLRENLTPQQRIEMIEYGKFRCRGAATGNMYEIEPSNGFAIVDKTTNESVVSYCLHTEYWMPHADVALSTKLLLEDEDTEPQVLEGARMTLLRQTEQRTPAQVVAAKIERDLIP